MFVENSLQILRFYVHVYYKNLKLLCALFRIATKMKTILKLKCQQCSQWNRIGVEKVLYNPDSPDPKVHVFLPLYLPIKVEKCAKCEAIIAKPEKIVKIVKQQTQEFLRSGKLKMLSYVVYIEPAFFAFPLRVGI